MIVSLSASCIGTEAQPATRTAVHIARKKFHGHSSIAHTDYRRKTGDVQQANAASGHRWRCPGESRVRLDFSPPAVPFACQSPKKSSLTLLSPSTELVDRS